MVTDPNGSPCGAIFHLPPLQIEIIYGQLCAGDPGWHKKLPPVNYVFDVDTDRPLIATLLRANGW